jgi:hypothetical protein
MRRSVQSHTCESLPHYRPSFTSSTRVAISVPGLSGLPLGPGFQKRVCPPAYSHAATESDSASS